MARGHAKRLRTGLAPLAQRDGNDHTRRTAALAHQEGPAPLLEGTQGMKPFSYRGWQIDVVPHEPSSGDKRGGLIGPGWFRSVKHGETRHSNRLKENALEALLAELDEREDSPKLDGCPSGYGGPCYFVRGHREDGMQTENAHCCHCDRAYKEEAAK